MEKTLKGIVQYARKNYFSYWVILGIDTALSVLCSLVAYAVILLGVSAIVGEWRRLAKLRHRAEIQTQSQQLLKSAVNLRCFFICRTSTGGQLMPRSEQISSY